MNTQATSRHAYALVVQSLGNRQIEVYKKLEEMGGATNNELASELGRQINTITPRMKELRDKGLVREKNKRPCKITGITAIEWELTQ